MAVYIGEEKVNLFGGRPVVEASGTIQIMENGLHDIKNYAKANINVSFYPKHITFTAVEENSTIMLKKVGNHTVPWHIFYSINNEAWNEYTFETQINLENVGDTVRFAGTGNFAASECTSANYYNFVMTGAISASGNCCGLITQESDAVLSYCFYRLFSGCTSLISAPELPSIALRDHCYYNMFYGCTALTSAPELPATTLASSCYQNMFSGCTALTSAPELPAMSLKDYCYSAMFKDCTSLVNAPELPARSMILNCYGSMFSGCTSLVSAPELPATTLQMQCYTGMFKGCTSLVNAPDLPATTMITGCYGEMFMNCTSLSTPPVISATGVRDTCFTGMFMNCTSLTAAPYLHVTSSATRSHMSMFKGCTNLSYIKIDFSGNFNSTNFDGWVDGVSSTGDFYYNGTDTTRGTSAIPTGWTVHTF